MNLSNYRQIARDYTSKASDVTRQLILGGIAVIWIFKTTDPKTQESAIPLFGVIPLITLCFAALLDLLQYFIGGEIWTSFYLEEEDKAKQKGEQDPIVKAPKKKGRFLQWIYYCKITLMLVSYILILIFLARYLNLK